MEGGFGSQGRWGGGGALLRYRAGHDDPFGQGGVLPVGEDHLWLPALRHAAQVHVQERLSLKVQPVSGCTLMSEGFIVDR